MRIALQNYIAGEWTDPGIELPGEICDANTGSPLMTQLGSTPVQIATAVEAAVDTHRRATWSGLPTVERAQALEQVAAALDGVVEAIAEVDAITTGVPVSTTTTLAKICGAAFRGAARLASESTIVRQANEFEIERLPLGPAAIIAPWNAPAGIACHKLASALAAGCPVLFKPSEWAPLSGQLITAAIAELGLPPGVFQLVHGDGMVGSALAGDTRVAAVSFTGGLAAGRAVAATCAHQVKPAQLELGGNNPMIVCRDADVDRAVDGIVAALTTLNGQWCRALGRLIVDETIADDLLERAIARLDGLRIDASTNPDTEMGPLVHERHRDHVKKAVADLAANGGSAHEAGTLPDLGGWFINPTLVTGVPAGDALGEVFGPVATVHSYAEIDEAVSLANLAPYGLAAYVFGESSTAAAIARRLETGMVKINAVTLFSPHPEAPRPAWKLSGLGDEGTRETFEFFRGSRVIGAPDGLPGVAA